jgi:hypothetical protein
MKANQGTEQAAEPDTMNKQRNHQSHTSFNFEAMHPA